MTLLNQAWTFRENNDEVVNLAFTDPNNDNAAIDITGAAIEVFFKPSVDTADGSATEKYSTTTGEVVIDSASGGTAHVNIPASFTATPTSTPIPVFKVDLVISGKRKTCAAGTYTILNT